MEVRNIGELIAALTVLAQQHGRGLKVGFPLQGKIAAVTKVEQWNMYPGPLCCPGEPPQPIKYVHLFANDWV